jgi:hypothetical protein
MWFWIIGGLIAAVVLKNAKPVPASGGTVVSYGVPSFVSGAASVSDVPTGNRQDYFATGAARSISALHQEEMLAEMAADSPGLRVINPSSVGGRAASPAANPSSLTGPQVVSKGSVAATGTAPASSSGAPLGRFGSTGPAIL